MNRKTVLCFSLLLATQACGGDPPDPGPDRGGTRIPPSQLTGASSCPPCGGPPGSFCTCTGSGIVPTGVCSGHAAPLVKSFIIPEGPGQDNVASPWDLNITDNGGCDDGAYICMEQSLTDSAGALFNPYVDTNTHHWMLMAGGGISGATGIATCWPILRFGGASYTTVTAYAPAGTGYDFVNLPVADGPKSFSVVVGRQGALGGPSGNFVGVGPDTAGRFSAVAYSAPGSTAYSWVRVAQITRPLANGSLTLMSTTPVKTTSSEPVPLGNNNGECGFRVIGGQNESITWNGSSAFLGPMASGQGANAYCAH